jgi:hypothetical protein
MMMTLIGHVYQTPIDMRTADRYPVRCYPGLQLQVVKNCYDEAYLHEVQNYNRPGLQEKKLTAGDVVTVVGCWMNFYGYYIQCTYQGVTYDLNPAHLTVQLT